MLLTFSAFISGAEISYFSLSMSDLEKLREDNPKKKQERRRQRQGKDIAAIPVGAPTAQEQPLYIQVTIPEEISSGQTIRVLAPDGRTKRVVIPQGMGPGSKFTVEFNGATAPG